MLTQLRQDRAKRDFSRCDWGRPWLHRLLQMTDLWKYNECRGCVTRLPQDFEIARESRYDVVPIHCYMAIAIECNWFGCNVPSVCGFEQLSMQRQAAGTMKGLQAVTSNVIFMSRSWHKRYHCDSSSVTDRLMLRMQPVHVWGVSHAVPFLRSASRSA